MSVPCVPRVVIATLGIDQHENGAIAVQRVLLESQMQVTYMGVLNTPAQVADRAAQVDAHVVGISCHSWEYLTLVPELLRELEARGLGSRVVIGGSVITAGDAEEMRRRGVAAVFDARASEAQIVDGIRDLADQEKAP